MAPSSETPSLLAKACLRSLESDDLIERLHVDCVNCGLIEGHGTRFHCLESSRRRVDYCSEARSCFANGKTMRKRVAVILSLVLLLEQSV